MRPSALSSLVLLAILGCRPPSGASKGMPRDSGETGAPATDSADEADSAGDTAHDSAAPIDSGEEPDAVCGDGLLDPAREECDGGADEACPGRCSLHCACPSLPASGTLELHVIDVGQGDSILVISPDGFTLLVDAGDRGAWSWIEPELDRLGVTELDFVLTSHFHSDHLGAMDEVLEAHPEVVAAFDGGRRYDSTSFDEYRRAAGERRWTLRVGDPIDMGPGLDVEVLNAHQGDWDNENNNSIVIRLVHGDVRLLLGGDCEAASCEDGLDPGPVDIYKVHHHGASDSSSEALLGEMLPVTALIPVGLDNSYGHPHAETLERLGAVGAEVWRTDLDGSLVVLSDGGSWTVNGLLPSGPE